MKQFIIVLQLVLLFSPLLFSQDRWDFQWEGNARDCYVYLPQSLGAQAGLPVVFDLHGIGDTYNEARTYHPSHLLGDSVGFITVYPDAYNKRWNSGIGDNPAYPTPNVDDVGFISLIIDSLVSRYNIDTSRVYSCGFSNGGFMSLKLAGRLGNRIAAVASVAGTIANSTAASYNTTRPVPALTIHGISDNKVKYFGGQVGLLSVDSTIEFLRNKNFCLLPAEVLIIPDLNPNDQSTVEKYVYRSSVNRSQIVHYKVIGGGHTWPSMPTFQGATVINRDIDAIKEIWNFFKQFSLTNPGSVSSVPPDPLTKPTAFALEQNYPNPFNPLTTIRYSLPSECRVKLSVYNILGQAVNELVNEKQSAGWKEVRWDAKDVSSGIYFYKLQTGNYIDVKKMMVVK
jgi:polyhydroxybutyrate depolymerase